MKTDDWPQLSFPRLESERLREEYSKANIILEYGSGGSTMLAARMKDKLVFSVESDRRWAQRLQQVTDNPDLPSQAILHYVDIGETGEWGRPKNETMWRHFHRYPLSIWTSPYFRQPDVVLIDGRFRPACAVATFALTAKPVIVLFDDYLDRLSYHGIESFVKPVEMVGRMAVFEVLPGQVILSDLPMIMDLFSHVTIDGQPTNYGLPHPLKS
ncbi:hypothetical protein [Paracoccus niistensis]|uniref:Class I SAM-dependent methyltransferase n=1 Tax=Paracoccus niistensis TaxID=632935 RepID=A0ABV6I8U2_9RHOB